ncbi:hypothetical protein Thiowin_02949 [Thiorhodovibrio winogradskyi]|uniref:AAA domain-containing protein n=1 Tax=Thiorhodovibrio winogradskyi TaxID=77007 RepID=A0ABZ0SCY6_9GAMM|nr:AAA family ATPase [Thiorhodovibrio winogradskyi]
MIKRRFRSILREYLDQFPTVALLGPRQVGKTTLTREIGDECASLYLDLESPPDRDKLEDPVEYLSGHLSHCDSRDCLVGPILGRGTQARQFRE